MDKLADAAQFKRLLESEHYWPCHYLFKFIVPAPQLPLFFETCEFLEPKDFSKRASKTGKYFSITFKRPMKSSDEVLKVYERLSSVKGLLSL